MIGDILHNVYGGLSCSLCAVATSASGPKPLSEGSNGCWPTILLVWDYRHRNMKIFQNILFVVFHYGSVLASAAAISPQDFSDDFLSRPSLRYLPKYFARSRSLQSSTVSVLVLPHHQSFQVSPSASSGTQGNRCSPKTCFSSQSQQYGTHRNNNGTKGQICPN